MVTLPRKSPHVQRREIGVEAAYGFGDNLFNATLIQQLSNQHNCKIDVAVQAQCADAFTNLSCIGEIVHITNLWEGVKKFQDLGYKQVHQLTQNVHFPKFKEQHPEHSLIDTAAWVGRDLGLPTFDQRPTFHPTEAERQVGQNFSSSQPTIAIESVYKSGQSWADDRAFQMILEKYAGHRVLWLSNQTPPASAIDCSKYTRRELLMTLQHVEVFFSVGSGFFCGSLALPREFQPKKLVCLWLDHYYKYEWRLAELKWLDIVWVHNHAELQAAL